MGKNFLFIFLRLPKEKRDKPIYDLIRILSKKNKVDVLYSKSIFAKEDELESLEKLKINLFELKKIGRGESIKSRIQNIVEAKQYSVVFFKNYLEAKFYLAHIVKYTPKSIAAAVIYDFNYIFMSVSDLEEDYNKIKFIDSNIINKIAVYNFFDVLLTNEKSAADFLNNLMPKTPVKVIENISDEPSVLKVIDAINKKKKEKKAKVAVRIIKTNGESSFNESAINVNMIKRNGFSYVDREENLIKSYNKAMVCGEADYVFVCKDDTILTTTVFEKVVFCIESSPLFGMVSPASVLYEEGIDFDEHYEKYIGENYANWEIVKYINDFCFIVKKDVVERVGKFDEKFNTVYFAQIDLCWRVLEKGFFTVIAGDAILYYTNNNKINIKDKIFQKDYEYLKIKWERKNPVFLQQFETENQKKVKDNK